MSSLVQISRRGDHWVYRMGYYGGWGGRHMATLGPFPVTDQPTPPISNHRLRECNWQKTAAINIPDDWLSGVYLGKLSCSHHRYESYIIFVVRDNRKADNHVPNERYHRERIQQVA